MRTDTLNWVLAEIVVGFRGLNAIKWLGQARRHRSGCLSGIDRSFPLCWSGYFAHRARPWRVV